MALTTMLVVATFLVTFSAGFMGQHNFGNREQLVIIGYQTALPIPQPPKLPGFPQMYLPPPPPLPIYGYRSSSSCNPNEPNQPNEPNKPNEPYPMPTFDDVRKAKPMHGRTYNGVAASTFINSKGEGGSDVMHFMKPKLNFESFKFRTPTFPTFEFKTPSFEFRTMPPFEFPKFEHKKPMSADEIRTYDPKDGETFVMSSVSEHHSSSNINGVKTGEGGVAAIYGDNAGVSELVDTYKIEP